jgi:nitrate reductase gamma subunit
MRSIHPKAALIERLLTVVLPALIMVLMGASSAAASWLIDSGKYHVSAHGQLTCLECHSDVTELVRHPEPRNVNRRPERPEHIDTCLSCHDAVADDLADGFHGTLKIDTPDEYHNCMACHDPHYQLSSGLDASRVAASVPASQRCSACHDFQEALPAPAYFDGAAGSCMDCHQQPDLASAAEHARVQALCFHCHAVTDKPEGEQTVGQDEPLGYTIDREAYRATPHAAMACLMCHTQAARYGHAPQPTEACLSCHTPHDEKKAHDAHLLVSCKACHLPGIQAVRQPETAMIIARRDPQPGQRTHVHDMITGKDMDTCRSCHFADNSVGAAAMVLPPKSILCMPCHAATFSAGDTVTLLSLLVFGVGMVLVFGFVLSGRRSASHAGHGAGTPFTTKIFIVFRTLFWDVLLQRRLYRRSSKRWLVHSLIFMPFLIRFVWGLTALIASLGYPHWAGTWVLLDKNHPVTAFVFDMTGILLLTGLIWAFWRDRQQRATQPADLSRQDRLALLIIGLLVVVGFVLEGARIAMTGQPPGSEWAFVGYALSLLFGASTTLTALYGYLWYLHAILTGAFVAYLPFSRLLHIILAPITLSLQALGDHEHRQKTHD